MVVQKYSTRLSEGGTGVSIVLHNTIQHGTAPRQGKEKASRPNFSERMSETEWEKVDFGNIFDCIVILFLSVNCEVTASQLALVVCGTF